MSETNFWPSTRQDIRNSEPTRFEHEIMDSYLKQNVHALEDLYVGTVCNKTRDEFILRVDVVKSQMFIVQSRDSNCAILLGGEYCNPDRASYAIIDSYKV